MSSTIASSSSSYYDIDTILAEEELIPVKNMGDFLHLAHLDPNYVHQNSNYNLISTPMYSSSPSSPSNPLKHRQQQQQQQQHILPEKTKFKMPLWSIERMAKLQFVQIQIPKHYNTKGREKLQADPVSINLHSISERFYQSGISLINLIQDILQENHKSSTSRMNKSSTFYKRYLESEKNDIKQLLLQLYTGERMRRIYDWTMSYIDDDVSDFTKKLTVMERRLFQCSADSSHAFEMWKLYGSRRIRVSETVLKAGVLGDIGNVHNSNNNDRNDHHRVRNKDVNTSGLEVASKRSKMISSDNDLNTSRKKKMRNY